MAILSNINDKFAVDSTGAIKFNGQAGTSGYILKSNGNAAPTWVDPDTVIGGPYLPLTGGTLTGNLAINGSNSLTVGGVISAGGTITCNNVGSDKKIAFRRTGANNFSIEHDSAFIYFYNETTSNVIFKMANNNDVTFAGDLSSSGTSKSLKYWRRLWTDANNDWGLNNNAGSGVISVSGMGTPSTSTTTFAGLITTETGGSVFGGSGSIPIYARSTGTVSYMQFQTSSTGSNGSNDGLTVGVNGSTAYIWQRENEDIHIGTNNTSAVTIDNSQNVGIGTTSPSAKLHISEQAESNYFLKLTGTLGTGNTYGFKTNGGNSQVLSLYDITSTNRLAVFGDTEIQFATTGTSRLYIGSSGKVGIGTTSPNAKLEVASGQAKTVTSGVEFARFGTSNEASNYATLTCEVKGGASASDRKWIFQTIESGVANAGNIIFQPSGGNVGIGTTVPSYKLEVNGGTALVGGGFYVSNDQTVLTSSTYTFRDAVYINNPNSTSAAVSANSVMSIGASSGNSVNTSLITTGAIGIGTASPTSNLTVLGAPANGTYLSYLYNSGTHNSSHGLNVQTAATNIAAYGLRVNTGSDSNALAVMGNGNTGIGIATPNSKLQVKGTVNTLLAHFGSQNNTNGQWNGISLGYAENANAAYRKIGIAAKALGDGAARQELHFLVNSNADSNSAGIGDTKMMIDKLGHVGIGNTAPQTTLHTGPTTTITNAFTARFAASNFFANGGNSMFYVPDTAANIMMFGSNQLGTNQIEFYHKNPGTSQSYVGRISTSGSATSYVTSSDYRLKENVIPMSDSISRINQLKPSRFNFIIDPETTVDGFLAHEVQNIVPEAIVGKKDAVNEDGSIIPQGIDQAKLVPLLVAAIQELEARVKELENK